MSPRKRSFFRVNRWQNIAASLRLHPRLLPVLSTKHARSKPPSRKLVLVQPVIWPPPLRAAAASPGFSGGLPRWLLADAGAEAEGAAVGESAGAAEASSAAGNANAGSSPEAAENEAEPARNDLELNEDQVAALASGFVEAKHEET